MHTHWNLHPALDADSTFSDDMEFTNGVWNPAVRAIAMIASLNIIVNMKGPDQARKVQEMLAKKKAIMPGGLVAELEHLVAPGKASAHASSFSDVVVATATPRKTT